MPDSPLELYPSRTDEHPARTLLHIHGGALIGGSRSTSSWPIERYTSRGFTVFSIHYRLATETKLPEIIEDFQDALEGVRTEGTKIGEYGSRSTGGHGWVRRRIPHLDGRNLRDPAKGTRLLLW
ncbi:TPA: hypothetical protein DCE37_21670 [Candidatus Latescibacteria bacterium]|nr:hypothetical protein [Candidatus Latescibacterota bacterium]